MIKIEYMNKQIKYSVAITLDLVTYGCPIFRPGPYITNVFATRRKNFSQWHRSFQRKMLSHWLKFLRHVAITLVIQGPDAEAWLHLRVARLQAQQWLPGDLPYCRGKHLTQRSLRRRCTAYGNMVIFGSSNDSLLIQHQVITCVNTDCCRSNPLEHRKAK